MDNRKIIEAAIEALEKHYAETRPDRDIEYTYGYLDAVGFLRDVVTGREHLEKP